MIKKLFTSCLLSLLLLCPITQASNSYTQAATQAKWDATQSIATSNDKIQDIAVVKDQKRQDRRVDRRDAATLLENTKRDDITMKQNVASAIIAAQVLRTTEVVSANVATLKAVHDQALSDRQFMLILTGFVAAMLFAVWAMAHRGSVKIQKAADVLIDRTILLEGHIQETTPWVVEAYKTNKG